MQIAKRDTFGTDGVGVRRFIRAGDPIPPGLELEDPSDVIERDGPAAVGPIGTAGTAPGPITGDYDEHSVEELQGEAARRGLTVEGTGKDGNVLKGDLVAALEAAD
jgi:hypothetical protein